MTSGDLKKRYNTSEDQVREINLAERLRTSIIPTRQNPTQFTNNINELFLAGRYFDAVGVSYQKCHHLK